jgi:hypothetical protein
VLNVTARPSGGIGPFNLTAKTCANLTHMMLYHEQVWRHGLTRLRLTRLDMNMNVTDWLLDAQAYSDLMYDPAAVNSSIHECELHYANQVTSHLPPHHPSYHPPHLPPRLRLPSHIASQTSPLLSGDLGLPTFPTLLFATVDDVDNGDDVYGTVSVT